MIIHDILSNCNTKMQISCEFMLWNAASQKIQFQMVSADALTIFSGIIILFRNSGKSADFPELFFHGGAVTRNCIFCWFVLICEKVLGAARRPRQTQNKNNSSAEDGQSAAEAILNRHISWFIPGKAYNKTVHKTSKEDSCIMERTYINEAQKAIGGTVKIGRASCRERG